MSQGHHTHVLHACSPWAVAPLARPRVEDTLQVGVEQLLGALPLHLLAVLVGRQATGAASAQSPGGPAAAGVEHSTASPAQPDQKPALDGRAALPAVYLKKGLVALSHLADLAARTPLAEKLEVSTLAHAEAARQFLLSVTWSPSAADELTYCQHNLTSACMQYAGAPEMMSLGAFRCGLPSGSSRLGTLFIARSEGSRIR